MHAAPRPLYSGHSGFLLVPAAPDREPVLLLSWLATLALGFIREAPT